VTDSAARTVVAFDLDLTLADTRAATSVALEEVNRVLEVTIDVAEFIERLGPPIGLGIHEVETDAGLDVDERDVVADHVVEIAGHLEALLAGLAAGVECPGGEGRDAPLPAQPDDLGRDHQHGQPAGQ